MDQLRHAEKPSTPQPEGTNPGRLSKHVKIFQNPEDLHVGLQKRRGN